MKLTKSSKFLKICSSLSMMKTTGIKVTAEMVHYWNEKNGHIKLD
jgi:hypothetical protein